MVGDEVDWRFMTVKVLYVEGEWANLSEIGDLGQLNASTLQDALYVALFGEDGARLSHYLAPYGILFSRRDDMWGVE